MIWKKELAPILKTTCYDVDYHMKNDVRVILKNTYSHFVVILFGERMNTGEKYLMQLDNQTVWKKEVGPILKILVLTWLITWKMMLGWYLTILVST